MRFVALLAVVGGLGPSLAMASPSRGAVSDKVWVYFTDKSPPGAPSPAARLLEARSALTPHAAARRTKVLGSRRVDEFDLPVPAAYIDGVRACGATVIHVSRWLNAVSVRAPAASRHDIARLPFVRKVVPVGSGRPAPGEVDTARGDDAPAAGPGGTPAADPFNYGPSHDQLAEIGVIAAHSIGLSGAGVIIAIHDTGFYRSHEVFQSLLAEGRLLAQYDFVNGDGETQNETGDNPAQHRHGTSTWSIVGGFRQGRLIGAAHGASFLLAKTEDVTSETPIEEDNWIAAMEWSDSLGADVISSSLSYIDWYTYADMDGDTAPITIAADVAASRGIVVCTAAGNWATQDWYYIGAPADGDSVIAVGASTPSGGIWDDSSHGPTYDGRTKPEVVARGSGTWCAVVPTATDTTSYRSEDGTSVSTPLVAGAAALLLEARPMLTPMEVRRALMLTADAAAHPDNDRGWGRINVLAALAFAASDVAGGGGMPAPGSFAPALAVEPNPCRGETRFTLRVPSGRDAPVTIEIYTVSGRRVRALASNGAGESVAWDGRDKSGRRLAPGTYLVRAVAAGAPLFEKVVIRP